MSPVATPAYTVIYTESLHHHRGRYPPLGFANVVDPQQRSAIRILALKVVGAQRSKIRHQVKCARDLLSPTMRQFLWDKAAMWVYFNRPTSPP